MNGGKLLVKCDVQHLLSYGFKSTDVQVLQIHDTRQHQLADVIYAHVALRASKKTCTVYGVLTWGIGICCIGFIMSGVSFPQ